MKHIQGIRRRTWAEINIDNAKHNYNIIRSAIDGKTKLCCVIKANAYGHGAVELARLYESWGADCFAVSNIEEALQLRKAGITTPIFFHSHHTAISCQFIFQPDWAYPQGQAQYLWK